MAEGQHTLAVDIVTPKRLRVAHTKPTGYQDDYNINQLGLTDFIHKQALIDAINALGQSSVVTYNKPSDEPIYLQYDATNDSVTLVVNGRFGTNTFTQLLVGDTDSTRLYLSNTFPLYTWTNSDRTTLQSINYSPAGLTQAIFDAGLWQLKIFNNA